MNSKLKKRLEKISKIIDLSIIHVYNEVALLKPGAYFGDLALKGEGEKRRAMIKMRSDTFLAYLDRHDYVSVI